MEPASTGQDRLEFKLVSPEKHIMAVAVDMVVVPGAAGDFGVLPNHAALISNLRPGLLTYYQGDKQQHIFVTSGFANVNEKGCTVLVDSCEFVEKMNLAEMEKLAQQIAEEIQIARTTSEQQELQKTREMLMLKVNLIKKVTQR
jgi:ATP synthase, F1 epsilon subunit (delta in mitochondria)